VAARETPTPAYLRPLASGPVADPILADRPSLDELNRRYAHRTLRELGGNKTRTAEALGIDRKTLSRLIGPEE
jgi:DNA-binding NtrC family response regulator